MRTNQSYICCIQPCLQLSNPSGVKAGIFRDNKVNTIAADALATCIVRITVTMVLTVKDEQVLVFHEIKYKMHGMYWFRSVIENVDIILYFQNSIQLDKIQGLHVAPRHPIGKIGWTTLLSGGNGHDKSKGFDLPSSWYCKCIACIQCVSATKCKYSYAQLNYIYIYKRPIFTFWSEIKWELLSFKLNNSTHTKTSKQRYQ